MSRQSTRMRGWLRVATLALALPIAGCFAFGHNNTDIDRTPEVNTGTSATIIYPGQGAPVLPPSLYGASPRPGSGSVRSSGTTPATAPSPGAPPTGTAPTYGAPTRGSPAPAYGGAPAAATPPEQAPAYGTPHQAGQPAGGMAMLGGAHMNEVEHTQYDEEPSYFKYLMLPFAILASPFTLAYEALVPDPEDGPELPRPRPTAPTVQNTQPVAPPDYETAMIQNLERELDQRQASAPPPSPAPQAPRSSIADELAELQRAPAPSAPPRSAPAVQTRRSTPRPSPPIAAPRGSSTGTGMVASTSGSTARTGASCARSSTRTSTVAPIASSTTIARPTRWRAWTRTPTSTGAWTPGPSTPAARCSAAARTATATARWTPGVSTVKASSSGSSATWTATAFGTA